MISLIMCIPGYEIDILGLSTPKGEIIAFEIQTTFYFRLAIKQAEGPDLGKPASQKRACLLACLPA